MAERTGLVLGGGGTKGAFEVGALAWLVHEGGLVPDVVAATSAGAIAGAKLAQARTAKELADRVAELRRDLLAMTRTDLVFGKQPWLAEVDGTPFGAAVDRFLVDRGRPAHAEGWPFTVPGGPEDGDPDPVVPEDPAEAEPVRRRRHARWSTFTTVLSALPALGRARKELAGNTGSLLTLDPLAAALRGEASASGIAAIDPALVARPGLDLRLAVTGLGSGRTRYVTGDGAVVGEDGTTPVDPGAAPVDVVEGVLASASVPMVFEPRPLGDDAYVDGGVLQNVPVEVAAALGATRIVAVMATVLDPPPDTATDWTGANFVSVLLRANSMISFQAHQRANVATPLPAGTTLTLVAPTVDLVSPFEVAQGLMLIDMDYGWLRAAEAHAEVAEEVRRGAMACTDTATSARERAWYVEEALWAAGAATPEQLALLGRVKADVRDALAARAGLGLDPPPGAEAWWQGWEAHDASRPDSLPEAPPLA